MTDLQQLFSAFLRTRPRKIVQRFFLPANEIDDLIEIGVGEAVGLQPDHIRIADGCFIWQAVRRNEADIRQKRTDGIQPGRMPAKGEYLPCRVRRESDAAIHRRFSRRAPVGLTVDDFAQLRKLPDAWFPWRLSERQFHL